MQNLIPVTIYGTVFRDERTGEESLDADTLRYTVDGSRLAAKQIQEAMHPETRRKMKPVRIMRLLLTKGESNG